MNISDLVVIYPSKFGGPVTQNAALTSFLRDIKESGLAKLIIEHNGIVLELEAKLDQYEAGDTVTFRVKDANTKEDVYRLTSDRMLYAVLLGVVLAESVNTAVWNRLNTTQGENSD